MTGVRPTTTAVADDPMDRPVHILAPEPSLTTRLAAVFQSQDAVVGPIRSARTSDVGIAAFLNRPLLAYSGANGGVLRQVRNGPLVDVGIDAPGVTAPLLGARTTSQLEPYLEAESMTLPPEIASALDDVSGGPNEARPA